jgi:hypothetical protein
MKCGEIKVLARPTIDNYIEFPGGSGIVVDIIPRENNEFVICVRDDEGVTHRVLGSVWNKFICRQLSVGG